MPCFRPDGLHVATASLDGYVKFYELEREDDSDPRLVAALFCLVFLTTIFLLKIPMLWNCSFFIHANTLFLAQSSMLRFQIFIREELKESF
jgi:hypothetical protein